MEYGPFVAQPYVCFEICIHALRQQNKKKWHKKFALCFGTMGNNIKFQKWHKKLYSYSGNIGNNFNK